MKRVRWFVLPIGCVTFLLASCATIPSELTKQVDQDLTFAEAKRAPERYRGKILLLGGTVSERMYLPGATKMLIHEHNVDYRNSPNLDGLSEGEFLVVVRPPVNPAQYPAGKPVTVVGKLTGVEPATGHGSLPSFDVLYLRSWESSSLTIEKTYDQPSCQRIIGTGC
jgi:starvation-inducible outer membrane lipoprotein